MPAKKKTGTLSGPPVFPTADPQIVTLIDNDSGERVFFDLRDGPVKFDDGLIESDAPVAPAPEEVE